MKKSATVLIAGLLASGCSTYQPADGQEISGQFPLLGQQGVSGKVSFYQKGADHLRHGRYGLAVMDLKRSLVQEGETSKVLSALGVAYDGIGRRDVALGFLERAVETDPTSLIARNNLGVALLNLGNTEAAKFHLERAQGGNPQLADTAAYNLAKTVQAEVEKAATAKQVVRVALPDRQILPQSPRPAPIQAAHNGRQPVNAVSAPIQVAQTVSDGTVQTYAKAAVSQQAAPVAGTVVRAAEPSAPNVQTAAGVQEPVVVAIDPVPAKQEPAVTPAVNVAALSTDVEQTPKIHPSVIDADQLAAVPALAADKTVFKPEFVELGTTLAEDEFLLPEFAELDKGPGLAEDLVVAIAIQSEPVAQTSIDMPVGESRTLVEELVAILAPRAVRSDYPEEAPVTSYGDETPAYGLPDGAIMIAGAPAAVAPSPVNISAAAKSEPVPAPELVVDVMYNIIQPRPVTVAEERTQPAMETPVLAGWNTKVIQVVRQQPIRPVAAQTLSLTETGDVTPLIVTAAIVVDSEG